ncbi:MAG: hypothetical protein U0Q12_02260 [Vicinamibacterales bacterium]
MELDRRSFIASLGGATAVSLMDSEARADALEHYMESRLDELAGQQPGVRRRNARPAGRAKGSRSSRAITDEGAGSLFVSNRSESVRKLDPMPANPTLCSISSMPIRAGQPRAPERDPRAQDRDVRKK